MKEERRVFNGVVELRQSGNGGAAKAVGYGAIFNSLSENLGGFREVIAEGAFDDVLGDDVRALFNHDSNLILGRNSAGTLALNVDQRGLQYEIDMPETTYAKDLSISMSRGDVTQSSFGFLVADDDWAEDSEGRVVRTIKKFARLLDVSPVTYPAYPETTAAQRSLDSYTEKRNAITAAQEGERRSRELFLAGVF